MTDLVIDHTALAERYLAVWNETDPTMRRQAVDDLYSPQARYVDPLVDAQGRDAIDATIAGAQAQFPGFVFRLGGPVDSHHDVARFTWELVPAGAPKNAEAAVIGFDVVTAGGDGRLHLVVGFLDRVPPG